MIVLLTGLMGSGKSTAAEILKKYTFTERYFAEALKQFALSIGFTYEEIYGTQEQKLHINEFWGISGREFMQKFGSEVCRDALPAIISNMKFAGRTMWCRVMEKHLQTCGNLVVSDGRFPDEAKLIKDYNGIIIRLERPANGDFVLVDSQTVDNQTAEMPPVHTLHKSELEIKNIVHDEIIVNNGSLEELENNLLAVLKKYGFSAAESKDSEAVESKNSEVDKLDDSSDDEYSLDPFDIYSNTYYDAYRINNTTDTSANKADTFVTHRHVELPRYIFYISLGLIIALVVNALYK